MEQKLNDLCQWLRNIKGITEIDINELVKYLPAYEDWIEAQKPVWDSKIIKCDFCGHSWAAVYHIEAKRLECPKCNNMTIY